MKDYRKWILLPLAAMALLVGCEGDGDGTGASGDFGDNDPNLVVAMGDSITAGYGLSRAAAYPALLAARIGKPVINSGVNGERAGEASARVNGVLSRNKPGYLLILYGANDATNGADPTQTINYLRSIIAAAKANKTVPIIGTIPNAFGSHDFSEGGVLTLNPLLVQMAKEEGAAVVDVNSAINDPALYQSDGLHPNAAGQDRIAAAFAGVF